MNDDPAFLEQVRAHIAFEGVPPPAVRLAPSPPLADYGQLPRLLRKLIHDEALHPPEWVIAGALDVANWIEDGDE